MPQEFVINTGDRSGPGKNPLGVLAYSIITASGFFSESVVVTSGAPNNLVNLTSSGLSNDGVQISTALPSGERAGWEIDLREPFENFQPPGANDANSAAVYTSAEIVEYDPGNSITLSNTTQIMYESTALDMNLNGVDTGDEFGFDIPFNNNGRDGVFLTKFEIAAQDPDNLGLVYTASISYDGGSSAVLLFMGIGS